VGIGSGERASRMIELALRYQDRRCVRYIGIDRFEDRPSRAPGLTLKRAHRWLAENGIAVQLIPGDPESVLMREANGLGPVDLVVISADQELVPHSRAWFYIPRILGKGASVYHEVSGTTPDRNEFRRISLEEIIDWADATARQYRRAA